MSSAADMLDVGCPELAPVLERMLSTRNCCASARHCSAPTVPWSICCVTSYLLGGTAITSRTDCTPTTPRRYSKNYVPRERPEGYPGFPPGISSPVLREVREKRRTAWEEEAKGAAKDEGVKADTEASATVPAGTVPAGTAVRVQAGSASKNAGKNAEKNASRSDRIAGKNAEK